MLAIKCRALIFCTGVLAFANALNKEGKEGGKRKAFVSLSAKPPEVERMFCRDFHLLAFD